MSVVMKGDSWFGSVKTAANIAAKGMEVVLQVKTASTLYPNAFVDEALLNVLNTPEGVHIVLQGRHPNGHVLIAMGYRYSSKKHYFSL